LKYGAKGNMVLKSVESQNVEFKSNYRLLIPVCGSIYVIVYENET